MSAIKVERYDDFTGGLNLRADQFQLAENQSPDMHNIEIDRAGGLFTRGAMREINPTVVTGGTWEPKRLFPFYGATGRAMLVTKTGVYHSTGGNFSVLNSALATPVATTNDDGAGLAEWGETLYGTRGNAVGFKWLTTDTYATLLTASGVGAWQAYISPVGNHMPIAKHVLVHANKMWVANTVEDGVEYPDRVRFSHEALPGDWQTDDYIDFKGGGKGVTGIASVAGQLIVFKPNAIYIVFGYESADHSIVELTNKLGVAKRDQIAQAEAGVYFYVHQQGLFYYDGNSILDLFLNMRPMYSLDYINDSVDNEQTSVAYLNRRLWLSMPFSRTSDVAYPSVAFVFDPSVEGGAWTANATADGYAPIGGCDFIASDGITHHYAIHPNLARVLKVEDYDYETDLLATLETSFTSYYRTKWVDGKMYSMKKMFRRPDFVVKQVDTTRQINVKVYHNYEEAVGNERKSFNLTLPSSASGAIWDIDFWDVGYWGVTSEGAQVMRGSNLGLARSVQLLLTGPIGLSWGLDSIAYKFNTRRVTG